MLSPCGCAWKVLHMAPALVSAQWELGPQDYWQSSHISSAFSEGCLWQTPEVLSLKLYFVTAAYSAWLLGKQGILGNLPEEQPSFSLWYARESGRWIFQLLSVRITRKVFCAVSQNALQGWTSLVHSDNELVNPFVGFLPYTTSLPHSPIDVSWDLFPGKLFTLKSLSQGQFLREPNQRQVIINILKKNPKNKNNLCSAHLHSSCRQGIVKEGMPE